MPRFNLIFHGMMLFKEEQTTVRVIIPKVKDHSVLYGDPESNVNPRVALSPLPQSVTVTGPIPSTIKLSRQISHRHYLILDGSKVGVGSLGLTDFEVIVPKPDAIVPYRKVDVRNQDILGNTSTSVIRGAAKPFCIADALCFVYLNFQNQPAQVRFGTDNPVTIMEMSTFNLCVYSQRECPPTEDTHFEEGQRAYHFTMPHDTEINRLLTRLDGATSPFDFHLSALGQAEPAHDPGPGTGMAADHLKNLPELFKCLKPLTDPTGCSGAMLDDGIE